MFSFIRRAISPMLSYAHNGLRQQHILFQARPNGDDRHNGRIIREPAITLGSFMLYGYIDRWLFAFGFSSNFFIYSIDLSFIYIRAQYSGVLTNINAEIVVSATYFIGLIYVALYNTMQVPLHSWFVVPLWQQISNARRVTKHKSLVVSYITIHKILKAYCRSRA